MRLDGVSQSQFHPAQTIVESLSVIKVGIMDERNNTNTAHTAIELHRASPLLLDGIKRTSYRFRHGRSSQGEAADVTGVSNLITVLFGGVGPSRVFILKISSNGRHTNCTELLATICHRKDS